LRLLLLAQALPARVAVAGQITVHLVAQRPALPVEQVVAVRAETLTPAVQAM
jgi:hypothetical protein